jgi:hypothetical protein
LRQILAAALALAALACSGSADQSKPVSKDTGKSSASLPDGWKARFDDSAASGDVASVSMEKDAVTFATRTAGIYYKPDMKAEKDYTFSGTFSQLTPSQTPQPYGLFVSGADLDKDTARYTAFLLRDDGKYQIATYAGSTPTVVVDWTVAAQMRELKGVKTSNTLTIRALQDAVHFLIGDREVHQMPRAQAGADGIAGVRIGPGLNVQLAEFSVKKFP